MVAKNTVIQDGQTYYPGQEIWDLGSIKAIAGLSGSVRHYEGEQKDFNKLPKYVSGGSTCFMVDSGKYYRFDEETKTWKEPNKVTSRFVHADEVYSILNGKIQKLSEDVSGMGTPLFYAGSVETADLLPVSPKLGAVYNIEQKSIYGEAGTNVAWNGALWDPLGPTFDLSLLLTKEDAKNIYLFKNQGLENAGKMLVVGEDGNVILKDAKDVDVEIDTTLTHSGKAADAKVVGDKISILKEDLATNLGKKQKSPNLINVNSSECVTGYYDSITGTFTSVDQGFTSNFIEFDSDSTYRYSFPTSWFSQDVTLWDESKQLIQSEKSLSNFRTISDGVATFKLDKSSPTYDSAFGTAKYIRFSAYKADADFSKMMAVKDIPYPSKFTPYFDEYVYSNHLKTYIENQIQNGIINLENNPLYAKTVLFTGDSICAGFIDNGDGTYGKQYGWAEIIKENNPSITMKNYGASGTTVATFDTATNSILQRLDTMYTEYPEADWIVLEGGVNDCYSSKVELGNITQGYTSSLDTTTFCGALESLFKKSIEYWPGKKICFIVTFKVPTAVNFKSYMDKAKEICEKWSIPYIDLYSKSGLEFNVDYIKNNYSYGQGGLHPNVEGYKIITPKIEAWMKSL